jgi:hypothetical protein
MIKIKYLTNDNCDIDKSIEKLDNIIKKIGFNYYIKLIIYNSYIWFFIGNIIRSLIQI